MKNCLRNRGDDSRAAILIILSKLGFRINKIKYNFILNCGPRRARTFDPLIMSQVL